MTRNIVERRKYLSWAVAERRRHLKRQAIAYKGGACVDCGYTKCAEALQFHHRNPQEKDFRIGSGLTKSWARLKAELDKCDLVCANCHAERHAVEDEAARTSQTIEIRKLVPERKPSELRHGTKTGYSRHGCRCTDCRAASTEAKRKWVRNKTSSM